MTRGLLEAELNKREREPVFGVPAAVCGLRHVHGGLRVLHGGVAQRLEQVVALEVKRVALGGGVLDHLRDRAGRELYLGLRAFTRDLDVLDLVIELLQILRRELVRRDTHLIELVSAELLHLCDGGVVGLSLRSLELG